MDEQLAGKAAQTRSGRTMEASGVDIRPASSPRAKGRGGNVATASSTTGWSKALRPEDSREMEAAGRHPETRFLPAMDRRWTVPRPTMAVSIAWRPRPRVPA